MQKRRRLKGDSLRVLEELFQALPPLDSDDYLRLLETAPRSELPPEALVRAFRQLPPGGVASRATLARLFRREGKRWDNLGPLVAYLRRRTDRQDYADALQTVLQRILEVLPTDRGQYAEKAWNAFCRHECVESWRKRHGRRGKRVSPESPVAVPKNRENFRDPLEAISESPPWHGSFESDHATRIEEIVIQVRDEIEDDFVRAVATAIWFESERPRVSGRSKLGNPPPLTDQFSEKSRDQINRALRQANSRLIAALLADPVLQSNDAARNLVAKLKGDAGTFNSFGSDENDG